MHYLVFAAMLVLFLAMLFNYKPKTRSKPASVVAVSLAFLLWIVASLALNKAISTNDLLASNGIQSVKIGLVSYGPLFMFTLLASAMGQQNRKESFQYIWDNLLLFVWLMFAMIASVYLARGLYIGLTDLSIYLKILDGARGEILRLGSAMVATGGFVLSYVVSAVLGALALLITDRQ